MGASGEASNVVVNWNLPCFYCISSAPLFISIEFGTDFFMLLWASSLAFLARPCFRPAKFVLDKPWGGLGPGISRLGFFKPGLKPDLARSMNRSTPSQNPNLLVGFKTHIPTTHLTNYNPFQAYAKPVNKMEYNSIIRAPNHVFLDAFESLL